MDPVITRIPSEILREIVLYTCEYIPLWEGMSNEMGSVPISLMPPFLASRVCRSWRYILLSDPTLWTCLLFPEMKPEVIVELLRRSGSALLNVHFIIRSSAFNRLAHDGTSDMLSSVFQQIHRFKTLHMTVNFDSMEKLPDYAKASIRLVLPYLKQPAPELQALHLPCFSTDRRLEKNISDALLKMNAPNLKYLFSHLLSRDVRELHCPSYHGLSKLRLILPEVGDVDCSHFLSFLELSPCLEFLYIWAPWSTIYVRLLDKDSISHKVNWPHLKRLTFYADKAVHFMDLILNNVVLPPTLTWDISSAHCVSDNAHWPPLAQLLSKAQFMSLFIRFFIEDDENDAVQLRFEENSDLEYAKKFERCYMYMWQATSQWDQLIESINFANIIDLKLVFDKTSFQSIPFSELFTSLPSLKFLSIDACNEETYLSFLSTLSLKTDVPAVSGSNASDNATTSETGSTQDSSPSIDPVNEEEGSESQRQLPNPQESFRCLFLRELYIDLKDIPLDEPLAVAVATCWDLRSKGGYPLQLSVQCSEIVWDDVQPTLSLQEVGGVGPVLSRGGGFIHVTSSINSFKTYTSSYRQQ